MGVVRTNKGPQEILNDPFINKGTAFTQEERDELGLNGLLPCRISTLDEQVKRRYMNFNNQPGDLSKYLYLNALQNRNSTLFYRLVQDHPDEMLPYIYTPTVGDASIQYSSIYSSSYREHRGFYISYPLKDKIDEMVQKYPAKDVDVIVVTDGERILGLGDLGVGGMTIPIGKLCLYTLFGGINPERTLPITLDVGTNRSELLKDPLYIGWRHERVRGKEYDDFIDAFVKAIKKRYPQVLLQWEDFAKPNAAPLLKRYQDQICSFNDDIQGTASVTLAAILAAVRVIKSRVKDQKIALLGGGTAGLGIAQMIVKAMLEEGMSEQEALERFYVVDIHGLIHTKLEGVEPHQKPFAQKYEKIAKWKVADPSHITLTDVVHNAQPTILIGVSTQAGAFTEEIIKTMTSYMPRPMIFPLSNPTVLSEATADDLIKWTDGKAIIATGSPFMPVHYKNKIYHIAQCNNVYIFPGVGLGAIACRSKKVTDEMFIIAAKTLSENSPMISDPAATLFPGFDSLQKVGKQIGVAVVKMAQEQGHAPRTSAEEIEKMVSATIWKPEYPTFKKG